MNLSAELLAELLAGLAALLAALATLGVPKAWDLIRVQLGYTADSRKLSMVESAQQRADWRTQVGELWERVDALQKSVDEWQGKYWASTNEIAALKGEHAACLARTAALEEMVNELRERMDWNVRKPTNDA